jgi:hypothetical protein
MFRYMGSKVPNAVIGEAFARDYLTRVFTVHLSTAYAATSHSSEREEWWRLELLLLRVLGVKPDETATLQITKTSAASASHRQVWTALRTAAKKEPFTEEESSTTITQVRSSSSATLKWVDAEYRRRLNAT